jgi:hypothetical protein
VAEPFVGPRYILNVPLIGETLVVHSSPTKNERAVFAAIVFAGILIDVA